MQPTAASGMATGGGYSSQGVRGVRGGQEFDPDEQGVFGVDLARAEAARATLPVSPPAASDVSAQPREFPIPPLRAGTGPSSGQASPRTPRTDLSATRSTYTINHKP